MATNTEPSGFGGFFQQYTKTWMHAVATAGLTAFGLLSFVHRGFVLLALACYIVPPIVLYITRRGDDAAGSSMSPTDAALAEQSESNGNERNGDERIESEDRSAPESGADSLGPPPAEPDARAESPSGDERESLEESPTADREPEIEAEAGSDPSSEPTADAEPSTESTGAAASESGRDEPSDEAEPATEDAAPTSEPRDESEPEPEPEWRPADAPTDATLLDAAVAGSSAVAVGEGGVVTMTDGEEWSITLEDGPAAQGQTLHGVDATADGAVAWVAGDGGAVGRLELDSGRHTDFSAPGDRTDNLAGIAVAGAAGDETVLLINGSGEVLGGRYRDGDCSWDEPLQPGSGSSLSDAILVDSSIGYCCDTNDGVFATEDGGESFEPIGIDDADGTPTGLAAGEDGTCFLCTDAGVVHRYDGSRWTPERVCEETLSGIARVGDRLAVCTADGAIHERDGPTADWERADADATAGLEAIALGDELGVAVGGEGTVVERR
ncbi:WD40/YVTN/BNR-like repeat-containing protein [Natronococcus roseus]|uniref:WD40/YVTN/BNR-like repeat-containing protein n=1 Tax=Natronococcus roseus TaxID=1052014 RepID=UPI00374CD12E